MNLLDLALLGTPQPISTPVEKNPISVTPPRLQAQQRPSPPPAAYERPFTPELYRGYQNFGSSMKTPEVRTEEPVSSVLSLVDLLTGRSQEQGSLSDLIRRSGKIVDNWGHYPDEAAAYVPRRAPRAMAPTEGPDTGEANPNAALPGGYFTRLRVPEGTTKNYDAVNGITGATGPYQFLRSTWGDIMKKAPHLGLTWDGFATPSKFKKQHEAAIRHFTTQNENAFRSSHGRAPSAAELYSMHLLGQNGGLRFLSDLKGPAQNTISGAVFDSNPWMRAFRSKPGHELLRYMASMMGEE